MVETVYLAGPIADAEDPHGWRNELSHRLTEYGIETNDPLERFDCTPGELTLVPDDEYERRNGWSEHVVPDSDIVEADIDLLAESDLMVVGGWNTDDHTVGTPMEVALANYIYDIPVVVWPAEGGCHTRASPWMRYHSDAFLEAVDTSLAAGVIGSRSVTHD